MSRHLAPLPRLDQHSQIPHSEVSLIHIDNLILALSLLGCNTGRFKRLSKVGKQLDEDIWGENELLEDCDTRQCLLGGNVVQRLKKRRDIGDLLDGRKDVEHAGSDTFLRE